MSYLVDTNVISELARRDPAASVAAWFEEVGEDALYISVLSLGELRRGIEKLPAGKRRESLRRWLERDLPAWFGDRLLPIDAAVADRWGRLQQAARRTFPSIDSLIAATALHHQLRLVTRNLADFDIPGLEKLNPWASSS